MRSLGRRSAIQRKPPFSLGHIVATGQSLGAGFPQTPTSTTQPFNNKMLFDSSGTYPVTGPFEGTLSLVPLISPQRPVVGGPYPQNIAGETPDIAFTNQLTALARAWRFTDFVLSDTNVSRDAADMNTIQKNGGGNSYQASIYETQEIQHVFGAAGFVALAVMMTHGEADADAFNLTYGAEVVQMQSDYESDLQAITGQTITGALGFPHIPLVLTQQNQECVSLFGPNTSAAQQLTIAVANPGKIIMAGPKYQFDFHDGLHLNDYRPLGELCAYAFWQEWLYRRYGWGKPWAPLWPTGITRSGTLVTISFNVPTPPLVWDGAHNGPHLPLASSGLGMWAPGFGFEAWDATQSISAASGSPIAITVPSTGGFVTGQSVLVEGGLGNTNMNGVHTCTVSGSTLILQGTTSNGTFSAGAGGATVKNLIGINSAAIVGNTVQLVLARTPTLGGKVGYAETPDSAYAGPGGGFAFKGRCGLLRDSSPFVGRSGFVNPNWCVEFTLAMP